MNKFFRKNSLLITVWAIIVGSFPFLVSAQLSTGLEIVGSTGLGTTDPKVAILNIIRIVLGFLGIVAVVIMLIGGFKWMTAAGDDTKIKTAKKVIINGLIGLIIILSAFLIVSFVVSKIGGQLGTNQDLGGNPNNPGGPGGPGGPNNNNLTIANIRPANNSIWPNRDVIVHVDFNWAIDQATLVPAVALGQLKLNYKDPVTGLFTVPLPGQWLVDGASGLQFVPEQNCPEPNVGFHCFSANSQIKIQISGLPNQPGLKSINGLALTCAPDQQNCFSVFSVGDRVFGPDQMRQPIIDAVDPADGAPGTWVTIWGRNFGATTGTVQLMQGGAVKATLVIPQVNGCQNQWGQTSVLVEIPQNSNASAQGQYQIRLNTQGLSESNQVPFSINNLNRPGLCLVNPGAAHPEDIVTLNGRKFQQGNLSQTIVFGDQLASQTAPVLNYNAGQIDKATVSVPNFNPGLTTIRYKLGEALSNGRQVEILPNANQAVVIRYLSTSSAPSGSYLTIFGSGFGNGKTNNRKVLFSTDNGGTIEANYDFPAICSSDFWQNNQIIVKVPATAAINLSAITVMVDGRQATTNAENYFRRVAGTPAPGICSLRPIEASVGQVITIAGDNFLTGAQTLVNFPSAIAGQIVSQAVARGNASATNQLLSLAVPANVVTGQLTVSTVANNQPATPSNGINFKIKGVAVRQANTLGGYFDWNFKTCDGCRYPEVEEQLSCNAMTGAFPAPKKNTTEVPINTMALAVHFNTTVQRPNSNQAVIIEQCNQGDQFSGVNCQAVGWNKHYFVFNDAIGSKLYTYLPENPGWQANTWYRVTINHDNIRYDGDGNWPMQADYSWNFKIGAANSRCRLSSLAISPNSYKSYIGQEKVFSASGQDNNCNLCQGQFDWSLDNNDQRAVLAGQQAPDGLFATITAQSLTAINNPVIIRATVRNQSAISSTASLFIDNPAPRLLQYNSCQANLPSPAPTGNRACLNSLITARFVLQDGAEADLNNFSESAVELTKAPVGQNCSEAVTGFTLDYLLGQNNQITGFTINLTGGLQANAHYCVNLKTGQGAIAGKVGVPLVGQKSWEFTTGQAECGLQQVLVNPAATQFKVLNQSRQYRAIAIGEACQAINQEGLNWNWQKDPADTRIINSVVGQGPRAVVTSGYWGSAHVLAAASLGQITVHNSNDNGVVIVSSDFLVNKVLPQISPVCRNALLGVGFNIALNPAAANLNKVQIFNAANQEVTNQFNKQLLYNSTTIGLIRTTDDGLLEANQTYSVLVPKNISSSVDLTLLNANACGVGSSPIQNNGAFQGCWFSASTTNQVCKITGASIVPATSTIQIGETAQFTGVTVGTVGNVELVLDTPFNWTIANDHAAYVSGYGQPLKNPAFVTGVAEGGALLDAKPLSRYQTSSLPTAHAIIKVRGVAEAPKVYSVDPGLGQTNVCRNRLVSVVFDQIIDPTTLNNQTVFLQYQSGLAELPWWQRIYNWFKSLLGNNVYASTGQPPAVGLWSSVSVDIQAFETTAMINGAPRQVTKLLVVPKQVLPATSRLRLQLRGGVNGILNLQGTSLSLAAQPDIYNVIGSSLAISFSTRSEICALDHVVLDPAYYLFSQSQGPLSSKDFLAEARSVENQALVSIPNYEWNWRWDSNSAQVAIVNSDTVLATVQAQNHNGQSIITVTASTTSGAPQAKKQAQAVVEVALCENPWPAADEVGLPVFQDAAYNFALHYCRDAGVAHETGDDLPALSADNSLPAFDPETLPGRNGLLREYLVGVPDTGDVIGLRIYQNPDHFLPSAWYQALLNNLAGHPQGLVVDGYPAVRDGSTIYIGATNLALPGLFGRLLGDQHGQMGYQSETPVIPWWRKLLAQLRLIDLPVATAATVSGQQIGCQKNSDGSSLICCQPSGTGGLVTCGATTLNQCQTSGSTGTVVCPQPVIDNCQVNSTTGALNCPAVTGLQDVVATNIATLPIENKGCQIDQTTNLLTCEAQDLTATSAINNNATSLNNTFSNALAAGSLFGGNPSMTAVSSVVVRGNLAVPAENQITDNNISNAQAYTTVFLISYNQGASTTTTEIVKRLLETVRFNINLGGNVDLKEKVIRDWQRVRDLTFLDKTIGNYHNDKKLFPVLASGSYISGLSNSVWPSWSATLSQELKQSLPSDPLNVMNINDPQGQNDPVCVGPAGDQANNGFEAKTCWNSEARQFACTNQAYFYGYQTVDRGANHSLVGRLETTRKWPDEQWITVDMVIGSPDNMNIVPLLCE